jgi:DNA topoisomerase-1
MAPAKTKKTTVTIDSSVWDAWSFVAKWEIITFEWFLKVYQWASKEKFLPSVTVWQVLYSSRIEALQTFAKPPARFTEASLVKKLEDLGIGRPSTYAPTIETIQRRGYVDKWMTEGVPRDHILLKLEQWTIEESVVVQKTWATKGKLVPTDIWMVVTQFLDKHFTDIMDYQFTARVEDEFDVIANWKLVRYDMLKKFYTPFHKRVAEVADTADRESGERVLWKHPESWRVMKVRIWRYGPLVQVGEQWEEDIEYASLPHGLHINTVTLEEAMTAFDLPRLLGDWNDKPLKANVGRFGPYVQRWSTFASLKQPEDPYSVEYERAVELIEEKIQKDIENLLRKMEVWWKEITIKKWRRWPFFMRWRKKISIKWVEVADLSVTDVEKIIIEKWGKIPKKKVAKKKATKKKKVVAKKKTAAKKK